LKKDKFRVYVLEFILLAILSFTLFVSNIYSRIILAVIFTVCSAATWFFLKKRKVESIHARKVTMLLTFFGIIYLIAFYLMGMYFGFNNSLIKFSSWSLLNYIIPTAVIIISSELMRNVLLAQKGKISNALTFFIMVMIDMVVFVDLYNVSGFTEVREIIGFTVFGSIASNLLFNYTSNRYGFVGNIIYRLLTVLYVYIIPFIPDMHMFLRAILRMVYPYLIFQVLEYTFANKEKTIARENKRKRIVGYVVTGIVITLGAMLISCQFRYGLMVIATGSMTGSINVGDAIVFEQYESVTEPLNVGEIVMFDKDGLPTVHRIIAIKNVNGEIRYTTKGDANKQEDEGYITDSDVKGVCKFRIPFMGYPTLWLSQAISK